MLLGLNGLVSRKSGGVPAAGCLSFEKLLAGFRKF